MTTLPLLYHWFGSDAHDVADRERERQQRAIDERRLAEFEMRNLPEVVDE